MYTVTVDVALPSGSDHLAQAEIPDLAEKLEALVLSRSGGYQIGKLHTVVSPVGVIFAVSIGAEDRSTAETRTRELISAALHDSDFGDWTLLSSSVEAGGPRSERYLSN